MYEMQETFRMALQKKDDELLNKIASLSRLYLASSPSPVPRLGVSSWAGGPPSLDARRRSVATTVTAVPSRNDATRATQRPRPSSLAPTEMEPVFARGCSI